MNSCCLSPEFVKEYSEILTDVSDYNDVSK